jgi:hypothetical protein
LAILSARHIFALDNTTNLGFETHVKHTVGLIKDEVTDVGKADASTLDKIDETARSSTEEVTSTLDLTELLVDVCTAVHDGGANPGTVGEFAGLIVNLRDQFTSRRQN